MGDMRRESGRLVVGERAYKDGVMNIRGGSRREKLREGNCHAWWRRMVDLLKGWFWLWLQWIRGLRCLGRWGTG